MKKIWFIAFCTVLIFNSCTKDDSPTEISIEDQNTQDDGAIVTFLNKTYFDSLGRIVFFDEEDPEDDNETPLIDIAQQLPSGVWYIKNPDLTLTGPSVTNPNTQKILLNYDFKVMNSKKEDDGTYNYQYYQSIENTINSTGLPTWNVIFYRVDLSESSTRTEDFYEMPGFKEAITYFNSSEKNAEDPYVFEGAIIIPSRENFARNSNYIGLTNFIAVVSIDLYQIQND